MNRTLKLVKVLLLPEFLIAASLAVILYTSFGMRSGLLVINMPFDAVAYVLRTLSLAGPAGNGIAIALYTLLSLLPVILLLTRIVRTHKTNWPDLLLPVLSAVCFYLLYAFINPGILLLRLTPKLRNAEMLPVLKGLVSALFYAVLIAYLVLKALRKQAAENAREDRFRHLASGLAKLLTVCIFFYTAVIGYFGIFSLFGRIDAAEGGADITFAVLQSLLTLVPQLFTAGILYCGLNLACVLDAGLFGPEEAAAGRLARVSRTAVYVSIGCNLVWNLLQFSFAGKLSRIHYEMEIPVLSFILAFAALLLSGYFKKAKEVKEDNEMII